MLEGSTPRSAWVAHSYKQLVSLFNNGFNTAETKLVRLDILWLAPKAHRQKWVRLLTQNHAAIKRTVNDVFLTCQVQPATSR
jgi:hypothetical protein